jgi:signal peptidase I
VRRVLGYVVLGAFLATWLVVLRPQALGGPAVYIVVRGSSMLPTYENGELVVVQAQADYAVGDVVAYRVPEGDIGEGHLIIHRLSGREPDGRFVVKGDNNDAIDPWHPLPMDIAGKAWLSVPGVGRLVAFIHQPFVAGAFGAGIAVTLVLGRSPGSRGGGRSSPVSQWAAVRRRRLAAVRPSPGR